MTEDDHTIEIDLYDGDFHITRRKGFKIEDDVTVSDPESALYIVEALLYEHALYETEDG